MWHKNQEIQRECVSRIRKIAQIRNPSDRYRRALQEIFHITSLPLDDACRTKFARVIAQYALHPDTPRDSRDQALAGGGLGKETS